MRLLILSNSALAMVVRLCRGSASPNGSAHFSHHQSRWIPRQQIRSKASRLPHLPSFVHLRRFSDSATQATARLSVHVQIDVSWLLARLLCYIHTWNSSIDLLVTVFSVPSNLLSFVTSFSGYFSPWPAHQSRTQRPSRKVLLSPSTLPPPRPISSRLLTRPPNVDSFANSICASYPFFGFSTSSTSSTEPISEMRRSRAWRRNSSLLVSASTSPSGSSTWATWLRVFH
jgi:hypothetical protein